MQFDLVHVTTNQAWHVRLSYRIFFYIFLVRFLNLIRPFMAILPEIPQPDRKVFFKLFDILVMS